MSPVPGNPLAPPWRAAFHTLRQRLRHGTQAASRSDATDLVGAPPLSGRTLAAIAAVLVVLIVMAAGLWICNLWEIADRDVRSNATSLAVVLTEQASRMFHASDLGLHELQD